MTSLGEMSSLEYIEKHVGQQYELTCEEVKIVDSGFAFSEEEYKNYKTE